MLKISLTCSSIVANVVVAGGAGFVSLLFFVRPPARIMLSVQIDDNQGFGFFVSMKRDSPCHSFANFCLVGVGKGVLTKQVLCQATCMCGCTIGLMDKVIGWVMQEVAFNLKNVGRGVGRSQRC